MIRPEDIDVVIPNYHTPLLTIDAAKSARDDGARSIIVVDNGSRDDSVSILKKEISDFATIIPLPENIGYTGACNRGMAMGRLPLVLFMNSDVVLQPGALSLMAKVCDEHPEVGIVGPSLYYPDGRTQTSAWLFVTPTRIAFSMLGLDRLSRFWPRFSSNVDVRHNGGYSGEVESLFGACLLCRRKAAEEINGFDERLRSSCEETDFILRLAKNGWKAYRVAEARAIHAHGKTVENFPVKHLVTSQESRWIYAKKHFNTFGCIITIIVSIIGMSLRLLFARTAIDRKRYFAALGVWLGWTSLEDRRW